MGKRFLIGFVVVAGILGLYVMNVMHDGEALDQSSKAYVDLAAPKILADWDIATAEKYFDYVQAGMKKDQFDNFIKLFHDKLGKMSSYGGSKGQAGIYYMIGKKTVSARYTVTAKFEKGDANILFALLNENGEWKMVGLHVDSPALLK